MNLHAVLARRDDNSSRALLVDRFYPAVQEMVHQKLRNELRSKPWLAALFSTGDVVHDLFMKVLQGIQTFDGNEQDFERYLAKSVTHHLLDMIRFHEAGCRDGRRVGRSFEVSELAAANKDTSPTSAAARHEEAVILAAALQGLTSRDRDLLDLRLRRGASYRDIARQLGLPSPDAARKATCLAEARLLVALRTRGLHG